MSYCCHFEWENILCPWSLYCTVGSTFTVHVVNVTKDRCVAVELLRYTENLRPVWAPGRNAPLIHLLISALYCILFTWLPHLLPFFFTYFPYLSTSLAFPLRMCPLHFQATSHKRWSNLGLSCFSLFWVIVFLCFWCMVILCCSKYNYSRWPSLGLLYISVVVLLLVLFSQF